MFILKHVTTLTQYLHCLKQAPSTHFAQLCCPHCGYATLWRHGSYGRKADRESSAEPSRNPILIQRFLCAACKKTCSILPECIPPRRWYLWDIQQAAFILLLTKASLRGVANKMLPSRQTVRRWWRRLQERFLFHKDVLCHYFSELGRTTDFNSFWLSFLAQLPLSKAMRLCHAAGVAVP